jgi:hypothetical protein
MQQNYFPISKLGVMSKLPTDREVLRCIYDMYAPEYPKVAAGQVRGENDPYVPIDIRAVAAKLKLQPELVFGRLYYHLDAKHRYKQENGAFVSLFQMNIQGKWHSVQFPYLASILAGQEQEHRKHLWSLWFSVLAVLLSFASLATNLLAKH